MPNNVDCVNLDSNFQVFETFKIEDKIEELKILVKSSKLGVFDDKHIIIVVPSFDESNRYIKKDDKELYLAQKSDAKWLSSFLINSTKAKTVEIVTDLHELHSVVDSSSEPIKFVILLHEFIQHEKDYVIREMKEDYLEQKVNEDLQVIELY